MDVADEWFETALRARTLARFDCDSEAKAKFFGPKPTPRRPVPEPIEGSTGPSVLRRGNIHLFLA